MRLLGPDGEEEDWFLVLVWLGGEEGDIAIGVLAVDDLGAWQAGTEFVFICSIRVAALFFVRFQFSAFCFRF